MFLISLVPTGVTRGMHEPPEVKMEKRKPMDLVKFVLIRCAAWGFSSSGVERSFSIGSWAKHVKREIPTSLANDEVLAIQYPEHKRDECRRFLF